MKPHTSTRPALALTLVLLLGCIASPALAD